MMKGKPNRARIPQTGRLLPLVLLGAVVICFMTGCDQEAVEREVKLPPGIIVSYMGDHIPPEIKGYMTILNLLYSEDEGLNADIDYIAVDTRGMHNLKPKQKERLLELVGNLGFQVMDTTYTQLVTEGYIKDSYFERGILLEIEDEPMLCDDKMVFKRIRKWRSGLGAIGISDVVLEWIEGQWVVTKQGDMSIS